MSAREAVSRRDVLVLSAAMFCFSLAFQMTSRYMPRYMSVLGAGAVAIGVYGTFGNLISALYPYPGGAFSDRVGSRRALTLFGLLSTLGFVVWLLAPRIGDVTVYVVEVPAWIWVFIGLLLAQAWKSLGLGASFAVVKQAASKQHLAAGFATTETFRRTAFLVGPLLAAAAFAVYVDFVAAFTLILAVAVAFAFFGTLSQHLLYRGEDSRGKEFEGVGQVVDDLRNMPEELKPLLVADTVVRFANGAVYVFFVIVVTELRMVDASLPVVGYLSPDAFFGVLLGVEMLVALLVMFPSAYVADRVGLKPIVALGFAVYAVFPVILIYAPASAAVYIALFAFSGLRFAGLPAHKALIVGPAEEKAGGRVTGSYYLVRNTLVVPSAVAGGVVYSVNPEAAFTLATFIGVVGVTYFLVYGEGFEPERRQSQEVQS